jgi:hypothetical protein
MSTEREERFMRSLQTRVEIQPGKFCVVRRPSEWESIETFRGTNIQPIDFMKFVVDWDGFTDLDIFPGGDSTPAKFERGLFNLWIQDHFKYMVALAEAVVKEHSDHRERLEEAEKK